MKNFKVGSLVVTSAGTYARILQIKHGICFCTALFDDAATAKKAPESGGFRFNEYSMKVCGIKLASQGGKDADTNEVKHSDAVVKLAEENDIDLAEVTGTGANGNIVVGDVQAAIKAKADAEAGDED